MERITFILSDESINEYGYRVLTDGIDLERFLKNPVMLYVHIRGFERNSGDPLLPIGRWENIRKSGTQLLGDAVFDEEDDFAMKVAKKVKKKILNTASIHADIVELSEDPALMLPGQMLPTLTKCTLKEVSIADIPGNGNAVRLNSQGNSPEELVKLFSNHKPNQSSMKNLIAKLNALKLSGVSLADTANEAEVMIALDSVIDKNKTLTELTTTQANEITQLKGEKKTLEDSVDAAAQTAKDEKAVLLVDNAVAAGKILAAAKEQYVKLAKADYDSTKSILDGLQAYKPIGKQINPDEADDDTVALAAEYDKLHKSGRLMALKASNLEKFKTLHKAKYGTEYKG